MASERQALLVFTNSAALDCEKRKWPRALQPLLECKNLPEWSKLGFDVHAFTSLRGDAVSAAPGTVHGQRGDSFGARLENAIETLSDLGYTKVVIVGSDCPDLQPADIRQAFSALKERQLVLGPDHRGGCYLIGLNTADRGRLHGIQWQRNTDFEELLRRFGVENSWLLAVKLDLDSWEDVRLLAKSSRRWRNVVATLLRLFQSHPSSTTARIPHIAKQRIRWQLPPPVLHANLPID